MVLLWCGCLLLVSLLLGLGVFLLLVVGWLLVVFF